MIFGSKNMQENIIELETLVDDLATQLADGFFQTVQVLTRITSALEKYYDGSHSRYVAEKSAMIARELGMSEENVMEVKIAGLLHDIGKVGMSEPLLFKYPTELTQQEYKQYSLHPEIGMQILKPYHAFDTIGEIIYQSHEKLDGSGFPRHLQRDNIHPGAKIIIVVDYFHNGLFRRQRQKSEITGGSGQVTSTMAFLDGTKDKYINTMNFLHKKSNILFEKKVVQLLTEIIEVERRTLGQRSVLRLPVNNLEPGMIFAEDYYTTFGMLVAAKGEVTTKESIHALGRFVESGEVPFKILVIK